MARRSTPSVSMGSVPVKAYLCLLLSSPAFFNLAHVAGATRLSLCPEGGTTPCPSSLKPASTREGTAAFFGGPENPGAFNAGLGNLKGPMASTGHPERPGAFFDVPESPGAFTEGSRDLKDSGASNGGPEDPGRGLTGIQSASPTPSPMGFINANATAECEEEGEACLADEECQGCYDIASGLTSSKEFEACREAYLGSSSSPSSPSLSDAISSTCDVVGATYCCSNDISESDCLAGDKSSVYWGCVFESYGCELEEVSCLAVGDSYRSDDDDVGGRASNPLSGTMRATPPQGVLGCVAVAAFSLAAAAAGMGMVV